MKNLLIVVISFMFIYGLIRSSQKSNSNEEKQPICNNSQEWYNTENRTTNKEYSSSLITSPVEEKRNPYKNNRLQTGTMPYGSSWSDGNESTISVSTSSSSECDVVVIVKKNGRMYCNVYIEAGDTYTFEVPNGSYQVFFYGGRGWNPNKSMSGGYRGGFVMNESFSKDSRMYLEYQSVEYNLIPQPNGNFSTQISDEREVF